MLVSRGQNFKLTFFNILFFIQNEIKLGFFYVSVNEEMVKLFKTKKFLVLLRLIFNISAF